MRRTCLHRHAGGKAAIGKAAASILRDIEDTLTRHATAYRIARHA